MKALLCILLLTAATSAHASANCAELKKELSAMQEAQAQIMRSLVSNHETFASTMEEYSEVLSDSKDSKSVSKSMDQSAKAFRARGVQGKRMSDRLNNATEDLFARVSACLK